MSKPLILLISLMLTSTTMWAAKDSGQKIPIDSNWEFRQIGIVQWLPAIVPGTVHTDLLNNKKIQDPYFRLNEHDLQWIDKVNWEYKTSFGVNAALLQSDHLSLDFKGLDTYADVYINDKLMLKADNMFREWTVDCKNELRVGDNTLRIYFHSPITEGLKKQEEYGFPLPAINDQSELGGLGMNRVSIFTRKAGYHYGWDWGPRFVTSGIWRPVYLNAWNDVSLTDLYVRQDKVTSQQASITGVFEINSAKGGNYKLTFENEGKELVSKTVNAPAGKSIFELKAEIKNPKLWWSNGLGEAHRYNFTGKVSNENVTDSRSVTTGLRSLTIARVPDTDGKGSSFNVLLNGVPVFTKGANYIPSDMFLPRITNAEYDRIVRLAYDANMNMLRVWGGGIYENDIFYDLCDKYGILVWQDFMFACSMYPDDKAFLDNVKAEAEDNVKRLRNHACIALYCGNNEIETAWAPYEGNGWGWKAQYTSEQQKRIWAAYDTIFHQILPSVIKKETSSAFYWHSSPSAEMGKQASYTSGDVHYWGVWHALHPFSDFPKYVGRFMSEYGFQSFPELASVKKYALPEDFDINSPVMASHQRSGIGNLRIKQYMKDHYRDPKDFASFLYLSHLLQADAIKYAIETHRSNMPYCMGTLYWQINDCWPVASWSSTDFYRRWKALHYFARKAYQNILIVSTEKEGKLNLSIVSDELNKRSATLKLVLSDFSGKPLWSKDVAVTIAPNTSKIYYTAEINDILGKYSKTDVVLSATLLSGKDIVASNLFYFNQPKDLNLPKPNIKYEVSGNGTEYTIKLNSNVLAKNIFIQTADGVEGQLSDNYFDLLPGKSTSIKLILSKPVDSNNLGIKLISLTDTY
ncbi:MAG: glycoside hydrolase family 2 protein [Bacteroidota bacterium]|nr:glycoside hydrolase family 2 protein [Bacteroidota bacterium]